ncbi:DMT family transporter [bacterium]|nr:DMT family transporter [bacterium]
MTLLFLAYFLLASGFSANKVLLGWLPPTFFVGIRMFCAGLIMVIYNYKKSDRLKFSHIKKDLLTILGISLFTTYIPSLLKAYALKGMPSSKAALIGSSDPFVTAMYAYILWKEKLSFKQFLGITIGFLGVLLLLSSGSLSEQPLHAWFIFSWPELAAVGSIIVGRYGWILVRNLLKKERYKPTEINGVSMLLSGVLALGTSLVVDPISSISIPSVPVFLAVFLYTIVAGNIAGYGLYAYCLKKYQITLVSLAGFSISIFVTLIGWLFLGEQLTFLFGVCAAMILVGLFVFHTDNLRISIFKRK